MVVAPSEAKKSAIRFPKSPAPGLSGGLCESAALALRRGGEDLPARPHLPLEEVARLPALLDVRGEPGPKQHTTLCWFRLSMLELRYTSVMRKSITLTLGAYWERRLTAAQKRFNRAYESLERVRKLSARVPKVQINVAAEGGQQVNVA